MYFIFGGKNTPHPKFNKANAMVLPFSYSIEAKSCVKEVKRTNEIGFWTHSVDLAMKLLQVQLHTDWCKYINRKKLKIESNLKALTAKIRYEMLKIV